MNKRGFKWHSKYNARILIGLAVMSCSSSTPAQKIYSERQATAPLIVNLPDFSPIIEMLDVTIVNVAGSSEPKAVAQERRRGDRRAPRGEPQPMDPFSDPQDFFERFFGMPGNPFQQPQQQQRRTLGSGFIVSKDGYILTNNHVVEGADKIEITLLQEDKNKKVSPYRATLVGRDPGTDVALLKIDAAKDLPFAYLADSTKIKKGEWVLAFGNPFGLDHSVSAGIISAVGREISPNENRRFDDFIQTDAAINFGNSGGPLVNMRGEVIGINTAITAQGSGIGFAVPINIAKHVGQQLRESGKVSRGYLGVMIQDVTEELKDAFGLKTASGVLVNDVVPDGPAGAAGLKRGDIIIKVNDKEVVDSKVLQKTVAEINPGASADLTIIRDKKEQKVKVKIGNLSDNNAPDKKTKETETKMDILGLSVSRAPDGKGVQVEDIEPGSGAAQVGVMPGDIIRKIDGAAITTIEDYKKIVSGLKVGKNVVLDLERGEMKMFLAFTIKAAPK